MSGGEVLSGAELLEHNIGESELLEHIWVVVLVEDGQKYEMR
jgi:hypothetical protein